MNNAHRYREIDPECRAQNGSAYSIESAKSQGRVLTPVPDVMRRHGVQGGVISVQVGSIAAPAGRHHRHAPMLQKAVAIIESKRIEFDHQDPLPLPLRNLCDAVCRAAKPVSSDAAAREALRVISAIGQATATGVQVSTFATG